LKSNSPSLGHGHESLASPIEIIFEGTKPIRLTDPIDAEILRRLRINQGDNGLENILVLVDLQFTPVIRRRTILIQDMNNFAVSPEHSLINTRFIFRCDSF